jgi:DnaJ domain
MVSTIVWKNGVTTVEGAVTIKERRTDENEPQQGPPQPQWGGSSSSRQRQSTTTSFHNNEQHRNRRHNQTTTTTSPNAFELVRFRSQAIELVESFEVVARNRKSTIDLVVPVRAHTHTQHAVFFTRANAESILVLSCVQLIARVQNGTKALSLIFPTHKPRHVAEGAVNLARSVVTGLGLAVLSVLALPIAGYRQGGWTGLVAGGLAGTLYGALFCVVGLANGAYQVARGAYHTPAALAALRLGQVWNTETESYQTYYLHDELAQVRIESAHQHERNDRTIKDPLYYNLLSVSPTDSVQTIQKAYRAKARLVHPDKNPNDAEAAHTFQKLHTAYTILTDPEQRAAYDLWGPTLTHV